MKNSLLFLQLFFPALLIAQDNKQLDKLFSLHLNTGLIYRPLLIDGKSSNRQTFLPINNPKQVPIAYEHSANTGWGGGAELELLYTKWNISLSSGFTVRYAQHYASLPTMVKFDTTGNETVLEWDLNKWGLVTDWHFSLTKYARWKYATVFANVGYGIMNRGLLFQSVWELPQGTTMRTHDREFTTAQLHIGLMKGRWKTAVGVLRPDFSYERMFGHHDIITEIRVMYRTDLLR